MTWPTPQDYNEAIQTPKISFADSELQRGMAEVNALGLPRPMSGAFATVYRFACHKNDWAVRCFLRNVQDQHARYDALSRFICADDLIYTVGFEYIENGIRVHGQWYPILKMEWVEGLSLDAAVVACLREPERLKFLAERFLCMTQSLGEAGIAHGDLQHGNIIIVDDDFRLVDYDGMFVPDLKGQSSNEVGHPNYQHPHRTQGHFGPFLDNFSAWVIYASLVSLSIDPTLWYRLIGGDDCLLFKRADFQNPLQSETFSILEHHESEEIRNLSKSIREILAMAPEAVPPPGKAVGSGVTLESLPQPVKDSKDRHLLPDWATSGYAQRGLVEIVSSIQSRTKFPTAAQYEAALRNKLECFADPELRSAIYSPESGKPTLQGEDAFIFRLQCERRDVALKCYKHDLHQRDLRLSAIERELKSIQGESPYFVDCEFLSNGIKVDGKWYPVSKMAWVEGLTIDKWIAAQLREWNIEGIKKISLQFRRLMLKMRMLKIAHGNLCHQNLMVEDRTLKLIDYDGMYVPALKGLFRVEIGSEEYQHPSRIVPNFDVDMDSYAAWLIDSILLYVLIANPGNFRYSWSRILKAVKGDTELGFWNMALSEQWRVFRSTELKDRLHLMRKLSERHANNIPPFAVDLA
jgi:predicted Ser/Thr protein kinase